MIEKTRLEQELEFSELRYSKNRRSIFQQSDKSKINTLNQSDKTKLEQELEGSEQDYTKNKRSLFYFTLALLIVASTGWYMYFMEHNELKVVREQLLTVKAKCEVSKQARKW
ncbi:MAG: hypothetical protein HQL05_08005 [Nitrospirae bacterium]|uniref:hypothetical protein n=1 Tax=Candidatus Magnetobacterium casense TaxID=1455061 RepID=UPI00058AC2EB|nr:hypothetical protein [Candidatus Magnetobacterium casensis]MBF0337762.1 hypothetical protein [Nitrospirota bacterium]